jgi:hypothetical protein
MQFDGNQYEVVSGTTADTANSQVTVLNSVFRANPRLQPIEIMGLIYVGSFDPTDLVVEYDLPAQWQTSLSFKRTLETLVRLGLVTEVAL